MNSETSISLESVAQMRPQVREINEARCNFCFNWISGNHLVKKALNSCSSCLAKYLNKHTRVYTEDGGRYNISLFLQTSKIKSFEVVESKSIHQQDKNEVHQSPKNKKELKNIIRDQSEKSNEEPLFDVKLSAIQKINTQKTEHVMDFVRAFNMETTKSVLLNRENMPEEKPHQSLIFNTPVRQKQKNEFLSLKKIGKLEDFGHSLDRTRFIQRYQYYYDNHTIQEFIEEHPKIEERIHTTKEFGRQILGNDIQKSISVKSRAPKSQRSRFSNESQLKTERLNEDQIKSKISCFLESKYHSETLARIMATYLKEAYQRTTITNKTLELINYKISSIDLFGYLNMFNFQQICILKMINVGLTDQQIPVLTNHIWNKPVQSLVLTGNKLTQNCLSVFLNKSLPYLKELYLGNNRISKTKLKENIAQLHSKFVLYL